MKTRPHINAFQKICYQLDHLYKPKKDLEQIIGGNAALIFFQSDTVQFRNYASIPILEINFEKGLQIYAITF